MLWPQQAHGLAELAFAARVVEIQHQHDQRALLAEREHPRGGRQQVALARDGRGIREARPQAHGRALAVIRRERDQRAIRKGHEPDAILVLIACCAKRQAALT